MNLTSFSYFTGMCNMTAESQHSPADAASPVMVSPNVSLDSPIPLLPPALNHPARTKDGVLIKAEPRGSSPNTDREEGVSLGQTEEHLPCHWQPAEEEASAAR